MTKNENRKQLANHNGARPKHGEIWMCRLGIGNGSVQSGYRPAFIVSNDMNNTHSRTVNIIPITKLGEQDQQLRHNHRSLPVHVELMEYQKYGLRKPSLLKVEQVTTVDKGVLGRRIGSIEDSGVLSLIREALKIQIPMLN